MEYDKNNPVIIGYYDDKAVYLLPTETWHELSRYCQQEGTHFPHNKGTFFKMLKERGIIVQDKDGNPTIQKKISGKNHRVLKLIKGAIVSYCVTFVTDETSN